MTVLVVDDEEMVRSFARAALRHQGYDILEAKDGREAIQVLVDAPARPSIALVDLSMPVMGGDKLVPFLNEKYPELKILLSTGYPENETQGQFPPGSISGVLQKPYNYVTLAEKVGEIAASLKRPPRAQQAAKPRSDDRRSEIRSE